MRLCEGEEDTYNFLPQAPLGAVSSAAEESEGKLMAELMSGAAFILKLNNIRAGALLAHIVHLLGSFLGSTALEGPPPSLFRAPGGT